MAISYGLKKCILNLDSSSYAMETASSENPMDYIDCSLGINPFGFSAQVEEALKSISLSTINSYPESNKALKETIIEYWDEIAELRYDNILFGSGSIDIIYKINKLFLDNQAKVLGYSPQFTDYIDDIKSYGSVYDYHLLTEKNNYKFNSEMFLEKIDQCHRLIYIDNPNNPTGQIIPLSHIKTIVQKAQDFKICVVIDEAYGEFMDKSNSAIGLLNQYNNVLVIRTFSKGLGLAGIRGGYMVASELFSQHYNKISNPYVINGIAGHLTIAALKDTQFITESRRKVFEAKIRFMKSLKKIRILETDLQVPIMTVKHPNSDADLEKILKDNGILSVSGRNFIGLDKSSVRLRIPSQVEQLINKFRNIESSL